MKVLHIFYFKKINGTACYFNLNLYIAISFAKVERFHAYGICWNILALTKSRPFLIMVAKNFIQIFKDGEILIQQCKLCI